MFNIPRISYTEFDAQVVQNIQTLDDEILSPMRGAGIISIICSIANFVFNQPVFISMIIGFSTFTIGLIARKLIERYASLTSFDQMVIAIERRAAWVLPILFTTSIALGLLSPEASQLIVTACGIYAGISWKPRRLVQLTKVD